MNENVEGVRLLDEEMALIGKRNIEVHELVIQLQELEERRQARGRIEPLRVQIKKEDLGNLFRGLWKKTVSKIKIKKSCSLFLQDYNKSINKQNVLNITKK